MSGGDEVRKQKRMGIVMQALAWLVLRGVRPIYLFLVYLLDEQRPTPTSPCRHGMPKTDFEKWCCSATSLVTTLLTVRLMVCR